MSRLTFPNLTDELANREFDEYIARCVTILEILFKQSDRILQDFRNWATQLPFDKSERLIFTHEPPLYRSADFLDIDPNSPTFTVACRDYPALARREGWLS
jgi:hypothetical protein